MLLTAELLLHYQRCQRRVFLDVYGQKTQKDPRSDFQKKILQDTIAHQQTVLKQQPQPSKQPEYPRGNLPAGFQATLALMQQGAEVIYQGMLQAPGEAIAGCAGIFPPGKLTLTSNPDLLMKQPGMSYFGDWLYAPMDIYLGKRPKQEYQIAAAYHLQVLAAVQGAWPEKTWFMLRERGIYEVDVWEWFPKMEAVQAKCLQMLRAKAEPELFISRQQCSFCPWLSQCYAKAKAQSHLSLLPGVTPVRYQYLRSLDITTLEELATTNPLYLQPTLDSEVAEQIVQQAQSVFHNQAILRPREIPILPSAAVEIYFDIEAQPDLKLDYLLGVLVVDKTTNTETFYPLIATQVAEEELVWQQFLDLVGSYPEAPIFHFANYEVDTIKRLAALYHTPPEKIQPLLARFVDIHVHITNTVILPIESYSLKAIASWLGFQWRDSQANGSQCIYWYEQWLITGDRTFLDIIIRYNEDDCRATQRVKDWLADFLQALYSASQ